MKPIFAGKVEQPAPPRCSLIIRAFNEEKHIGRLLAGIMQQTVKDVEIILVDSGSTDATTAIARRYPISILHILPENFTFGRSLNQGISHSKGDLIVIASAHVYPVFPDWLEKLIEPFENPDVALVYGKQRGDASTKFSENQVFAQWFSDQSQLNQSHPFCNNANVAIRRSVWQQHPYDESLTGLEDLEWARWAKDQGHSIAYISEAEVVHVHNETPKGVYNRYRREAMAFKRIFPQERFSLIDFFYLTITNITSDLIQAARQKVLWPNLGGIFWFRLMQFGGTFQGYRHSGPVTWKLRRTFYYPRYAGAQVKTHPRNVEPINYHE